MSIKTELKQPGFSSFEELTEQYKINMEKESQILNYTKETLRLVNNWEKIKSLMTALLKSDEISWDTFITAIQENKDIFK